MLRRIEHASRITAAASFGHRSYGGDLWLQWYEHTAHGVLQEALLWNFVVDQGRLNEVLQEALGWKFVLGSFAALE